MTLWNSDEELFAITRKDLYTAVVGDIMDTMGLKTQFLPPQVQPLREDMVVIGRAMPVLEADDDGGEGGMGLGDLRKLKKGHPNKIALARELRSKTTMTMAWIAKELNAGVPQTLWRALWASSEKCDNTRD